MEVIRTSRIGFVILHVVMWILGFILAGNAITYPKEFNDFQYIIGDWKWVDLIGTAFNAVLFYAVALWLAPKFAIHQKWGRFVGFLLLTWLMLGTLEYAIDSVMVPGYPQQYFLRLYLHALVLKWTLFSVFALAYRFTIDRYLNQKLEQEKHQQQLEAELKFLKAQISPHFLFNTLNNIYGEALDSGSDFVAEKIARLSGLMRYMIYDTDVREVALAKEIECIEGLIALNALKADEEDKLEVDFKVEGSISRFSIVPLILVPFVENALKHGYRMYKHSPVHIRIRTQDESLIFETKNRLFEKQNNMEGQSGLGLKNIKKRLDLIYGDDYHLEIKEDSDYFSVLLQIKILRA